MLFVSSGTEMEPVSNLKAKRHVDLRDPIIFWWSVFKFHLADVPGLFFQSRHKVALADYQDEKH